MHNLARQDGVDDVCAWRDVLALDFDGVICDSAAETGVTGWRAGTQVWPDWHGLEPPPACLEQFVRLRPVLETGYQAILLMRMIQVGTAGARILAEFPTLCERVLDQCRASPAQLVRLFGETRDAWIERDAEDWLSRHRFYPHVVDAVRTWAAQARVFILTTKQERFTTALLERARIRLSEDRVFGLDRGVPKEVTLEALLQRPELGHARIHFVEDRLDTLVRVAAVPALAEVALYLADWGYNTPEIRAEAAGIARIEVVGIERFARGWGGTAEMA